MSLNVFSLKKKIYFLIMIQKLLFIFLVFSNSIYLNAQCRIDTINTYKFIPGTSLKEISGRNIYKYNSQNKLIEEIEQSFSEIGNKWQNESKETFTYDNYSNIIENILLSWDDNSSQWLYYWRVIYAYNSQQQLLEHISTIWDATTNSWLNNSKKANHSYNSKGKLLGFEATIWNSLQQNWDKAYKIVNEYDTLGNQTSELLQNWVGATNQWQNEEIINFIFNNDQQLEYQLHKNWIQSTQSWKNKLLFSKIYNNKKLVEETRSGFNALDQIINQYRYKLLYNQNDSLVEKLHESWEINSNSWQNYYKESRVYNPQSLMAEYLTQNWNGGTLTWENHQKYTYEYNQDKQLIARDYYNQWIESGSYFNFHTREEYICKQTLSVQNVDLKDKIKFYPNPASTSLQIETTQVGTYSLIDYMGKIVLTGKLINGENQLDISSLPNGMYLLQINNTIHKIQIHK